MQNLVPTPLAPDLDAKAAIAGEPQPDDYAATDPAAPASIATALAELRAQVWTAQADPHRPAPLSGGNMVL